MSISTKIDEISSLLQKIRMSDVLVADNGFEEVTVADMKSVAKDLCDEAKDDIDDIKGIIDEWS